MHYFIINPRSKTQKGLEIWGQVQRELQRRKVDYRYYFTKYRGHAGKLAALTAERLHDDDVLAVIGGDGTMNEVINGLPHPVAFSVGYIPTGSGNDFARGMNIPTEVSAALELILNPAGFKKMDLGSVAGGKRKRIFGVSTGIGFDASICYEALTTPLKRIMNKLHLGKLTYALLAIKQLFFFEPCTMALRLDDNRVVTLPKVYFIAVMNQPYEGGGFRFCPAADCADGQLDVIAVAGLPKWKVLLLFPTAYFGKHTKINGIHIYRCRQIHIESSQRHHLHADGESLGAHRKLSVSTGAHQLNIITS